MKYSNKNVEKGRFRKWCWRFIFLILILLLLLDLNHINLALDTLAKLTIDHGDTLNSLQNEIHNLEVQNTDLQSQVEGLTLKINGEVHNIHNEIPKTEVHNVSTIHTPSIFTPASMITTTTVTVLTLLKGIASFIPVLQ